MKQFNYTITDALGIHARPAGMLVKAAKMYADTEITISCNGKTAKAAQLGVSNLLLYIRRLSYGIQSNRKNQ